MRIAHIDGSGGMGACMTVALVVIRSGRYEVAGEIKVCQSEPEKGVPGRDLRSKHCDFLPFRK